MKLPILENNIYLQLKTIKPNYLEDGFEILGVFGSFARSEESPDSDIDILYRSLDKLEETYPGWLIFYYSFANSKILILRSSLILIL